MVCIHVSHSRNVCKWAHAGANLEVDVPWKYLNFFLDDDMRLREIGREYGAGRMLTGEVKKELIGVRPVWPESPHLSHRLQASAPYALTGCSLRAREFKRAERHQATGAARTALAQVERARVMKPDTACSAVTRCCRNWWRRTRRRAPR